MPPSPARPGPARPDVSQRSSGFGASARERAPCIAVACGYGMASLSGMPRSCRPTWRRGAASMNLDSAKGAGASLSEMGVIGCDDRSDRTPSTAARESAPQMSSQQHPNRNAARSVCFGSLLWLVDMRRITEALTTEGGRRGGWTTKPRAPENLAQQDAYIAAIASISIVWPPRLTTHMTHRRRSRWLQAVGTLKAPPESGTC